jgi:hypothetical protein
LGKLTLQAADFVEIGLWFRDVIPMSGSSWWDDEVIQEGGLMVEMNFIQYGGPSYLPVFTRSLRDLL